MNKELTNFIDDLVEAKVLGITDVEVIDQIKSDLYSRVEDLVNAEIIANMPEYAIPDFEKVIDTGNAEEIQTFCKSKIPNLELIVAVALNRFKNQYLTERAS